MVSIAEAHEYSKKSLDLSLGKCYDRLITRQKEGEMLVTIPFDRVLRIAKALGDVERLCPKKGHPCFEDRDLKRYDPNASECAACWAQYLLNEN